MPISEILQFLLKKATAPIFHPNFGVFPWTRSPLLELRGDAELIIHMITFELTQLIRSQ